MTTQTPTDFIRNLTNAAMAECQKNLRKYARGMMGEGKAEGKLPDGSTVVCTYSETVSLYGRPTSRSSFTIDGKRASKEQISVALGGRTKAMVADMNPVLRAAFEAQAPELKADYIAFITLAFNHQQKELGRVPSWADYRQVGVHAAHLINHQLRPVCKHNTVKGDLAGRESYLTLDETALDKVAHAYAEDMAVQWFYKTNEKLGNLDDAELIADRGGDVIVRGLRDGKKIEMRQQRILKQSVHGKLFHQFPARLYVDNKFVTESAYKKMFGDEK